MTEKRQKFHFDLSIDMTLDELDRELNKSYSDPVRSRILEAARAHGLGEIEAQLRPDGGTDGGTHFDSPHIDR